MADELLLPDDGGAKAPPPARPVPPAPPGPVPSPRRALEVATGSAARASAAAGITPTPKNSLDWFKTESAHFGLALAVGALVCAYMHFGAGFDFRFSVLVGVAVAVFGRSLTHLVLPEHRAETAANTTAASQPTDTLREIVETIVFVVVLVLLLKSFVAEAFVIPTGSMATTLWGYQKVVDCPECGYSFPVNASLEADPQEGQQPLKVTGCTCPNCRYSIDFADEARKNPHWSVPSWSSGDRVLVAKFLYDLLGRSPDRLDVVVFKFPGDSPRPWPESGPYTRNYVPMNYIKRLIGLSGEIIAVHGGNLYRIPADKVPTEVQKDFADDAEDSASDGSPQLWQMRYTHTKVGTEARRFFDENRSLFEIIRKPPDTMLAMSRIVYDHDHPARDLTDERWRRWKGDGWTPTGHTFAHPGGSESTTDWLTYRHILRRDPRDGHDAGGAPQLITDFMGYNSAVFRDGTFVRDTGVNWANELLVECETTVDQAKGTLILALSRGVDRFEARFDLASGNCKLIRIGEGGEKELDTRPTEMNKPGTYHLRFADYDERLTVWVDNALPFGDGVVFAPPAQTGPKDENDLQRPAAVGSKGASVRLNHLQVYRDTYYTAQEDGSPSAGDVRGVDWKNPNDWGRLSDLPVRTMRVQPGHYLCLGDNSPESSDGRTWGLVPDRLLLGRALLVYYPVWPFAQVSRAGRIH
jgi:signal peptidase I